MFLKEGRDIRMDSRLKIQINQLADEVRNVFGVQVPILDMVNVVKKFGGQVKYNDDVVDGSIRKDGDSFIIMLSSQFKDTPRGRFTIAHELGHLFCIWVIK